MLMKFLYLINKIKRIFKIVTENFKVKFLKNTLSCNNQNNEFACMVIVKLSFAIYRVSPRHFLCHLHTDNGTFNSVDHISVVCGTICLCFCYLEFVKNTISDIQCVIPRFFSGTGFDF